VANMSVGVLSEAVAAAVCTSWAATSTGGAATLLEGPSPRLHVLSTPGVDYYHVSNPTLETSLGLI
jgi:hypothetical protein